jgi:DoxX-like family
MNIVLWTLQGVLAAFCLAAAANHLLMPMARLRTSTPWTEALGEPRTRVIGALELLAAIGLVLPGITHIATVLTPLAAVASSSCFSAPSLSTWAAARPG